MYSLVGGKVAFGRKSFATNRALERSFLGVSSFMQQRLASGWENFWAEATLDQSA